MNTLALALTALAGIHRVEWRERCAYLGDPIPFEDDVVRWDRFVERAAEPERLRHVPRVRELLQVHANDFGAIPPTNARVDTSSLGVLHPG